MDFAGQGITGVCNFQTLCRVNITGGGLIAEIDLVLHALLNGQQLIQGLCACIVNPPAGVSIGFPLTIAYIILHHRGGVIKDDAHSSDAACRAVNGENTVVIVLGIAELIAGSEGRQRHADCMGDTDGRRRIIARCGHVPIVG